MFRHYDKDGDGYLDRSRVFEVLREIDGLYNGTEHKTKIKNFKMSDLQYD